MKFFVAGLSLIIWNLLVVGVVAKPVLLGVGGGGGSKGFGLPADSSFRIESYSSKRSNKPATQFVGELMGLDVKTLEMNVSQGTLTLSPTDMSLQIGAAKWTAVHTATQYSYQLNDRVLLKLEAGAGNSSPNTSDRNRANANNNNAINDEAATLFLFGKAVLNDVEFQLPVASAQSAAGNANANAAVSLASAKDIYTQMCISEIALKGRISLDITGMEAKLKEECEYKYKKAFGDPKSAQQSMSLLYSLDTLSKLIHLSIKQLDQSAKLALMNTSFIQLFAESDKASKLSFMQLQSDFNESCLQKTDEIEKKFERFDESQAASVTEMNTKMAETIQSAMSSFKGEIEDKFVLIEQQSLFNLTDLQKNTTISIDQMQSEFQKQIADNEATQKQQLEMIQLNLFEQLQHSNNTNELQFSNISFQLQNLTESVKANLNDIQLQQATKYDALNNSIFELIHMNENRTSEELNNISELLSNQLNQLQQQLLNQSISQEIFVNKSIEVITETLSHSFNESFSDHTSQINLLSNTISEAIGALNSSLFEINANISKNLTDFEESSNLKFSQLQLQTATNLTYLQSSIGFEIKEHFNVINSTFEALNSSLSNKLIELNQTFTIENELLTSNLLKVKEEIEDNVATVTQKTSDFLIEKLEGIIDAFESVTTQQNETHFNEIENTTQTFIQLLNQTNLQFETKLQYQFNNLTEISRLLNNSNLFEFDQIHQTISANLMETENSFNLFNESFSNQLQHLNSSQQKSNLEVNDQMEQLFVNISNSIEIVNNKTINLIASANETQQKQFENLSKELNEFEKQNNSYQMELRKNISDSFQLVTAKTIANISSLQIEFNGKQQNLSNQLQFFNETIQQKFQQILKENISNIESNILLQQKFLNGKIENTTENITKQFNLMNESISVSKDAIFHKISEIQIENDNKFGKLNENISISLIKQQMENEFELKHLQRNISIVNEQTMKNISNLNVSIGNIIFQTNKNLSIAIENISTVFQNEKNAINLQFSNISEQIQKLNNSNQKEFLSLKEQQIAIQLNISQQKIQQNNSVNLLTENLVKLESNFTKKLIENIQFLNNSIFINEMTSKNELINIHNTLQTFLREEEQKRVKNVTEISIEFAKNVSFLQNMIQNVNLTVKQNISKIETSLSDLQNQFLKNVSSLNTSVVIQFQQFEKHLNYSIANLFESVNKSLEKEGKEINSELVSVKSHLQSIIQNLTIANEIHFAQFKQQLSELVVQSKQIESFYYSLKEELNQLNISLIIQQMKTNSLEILTNHLSNSQMEQTKELNSLQLSNQLTNQTLQGMNAILTRLENDQIGRLINESKTQSVAINSLQLNEQILNEKLNIYSNLTQQLIWNQKEFQNSISEKTNEVNEKLKAAQLDTINKCDANLNAEIKQINENQQKSVAAIQTEIENAKLGTKSDIEAKFTSIESKLSTTIGSVETLNAHIEKYYPPKTEFSTFQQTNSELIQRLESRLTALETQSQTQQLKLSEAQFVINSQADKIKQLENELFDYRKSTASASEVAELRRMFLELQTSVVSHTGKVLEVVTNAFQSSSSSGSIASVGPEK